MSDGLQQAVIFALGKDDDDSSIKELCRLLDTAGAVCVETFIQNASPEAKTYIGSGKAKEIALYCDANEIDLAVCNDELSPSQIKNLEDIMEGVEVIDRSMLILEIFKKHAVSGEGKLQVEIAQLRYTVPRLIGKGAQLSRQGGGGGGGGGARRGAGETKLETDRRHVKHRIEYLNQQLEELERTTNLKRNSRQRSGIPLVAIAGYTNAGKSTLLNHLTGAGILAEDKLFATLDTTTRKFTLPEGKEILLTDTVGFIQNLPHHLIKAFRSTLDEVKYADAIIIVADASDENCIAQLEVSEKLLAELSAGDKPTLYVFNKCDIATDFPTELLQTKFTQSVKISAKTGEGTENFVKALEELVFGNVKTLRFLFSHSEGAWLNRIYKEAKVLDVEYTERGTLVVAEISGNKISYFSKFICEE